jgi:hypothetical protein
MSHLHNTICLDHRDEHVTHTPCHGMADTSGHLRTTGAQPPPHGARSGYSTAQHPSVLYSIGSFPSALGERHTTVSRVSTHTHTNNRHTYRHLDVLTNHSMYIHKIHTQSKKKGHMLESSKR